jgi:hypothetical protein
MSIFDAYDQEFASLSRDINNNVSDLKSYASNPGKLVQNIPRSCILMYVLEFIFMRYFVALCPPPISRREKHEPDPTRGGPHKPGRRSGKRS